MSASTTENAKVKNEKDKAPRCSPIMFEDSEELMEIDGVHPDNALEFLGEPSTSGRKKKLTETWCGVPMTEIYRGSTPWNAPEFPTVCPAYNHAVLYHIPKSSSINFGRQPPIPQQGKDLWDKEHVRMPFSMQSVYPVEQNNGDSILHNRWDLINEALSQPIKNSHELEVAILKYNHKYKSQWKFTALHTLFDEYLTEEETEYFFNSILPSMINLALRLPQLVPSSIPLLRQHFNRSISLSQQQIACLLSNAFFCTFPRRNTNKLKSEYATYPDINFYRLFMSNSNATLEKLKCICHYFRRVTKSVPCGNITFSRRTVEPSKCPDWSKSKELLGSIPLHINSNGTIETDGVGLLQVDFANKFLGGGVLGHGCVQEEIRFVICPELIVSMLFTECLRPTEALLMIGCERYSEYTGYADSFQWSDNHKDSTPLDSSGRRRCAIIAIDALYFKTSSFQYEPAFITRELNKAWVGYSVNVDPDVPGLTVPGVATGNWGCGAFRGSPQLKALLQLMACCKTRRPIVYYTFGDTQLRDNTIKMYNFLSQQNITVGDLYKYLCQFHKSKASEDQLYPFILQLHKDTQNKPQITQKLTTLLKKPFTLIQPSDETNGESKSTANIKHISSEPSSIVESVLSNDDSQDSHSRNHDSDKSKETVHDIEKALTNHQPRSRKTSLIDELTHLDETASKLSESPASPSKKHGKLNFFELVSTDKPEKCVEKPKYITLPNNKVECSEIVKGSPKKDAKSQIKTPSGKISDYFQRLPRDK